MDNFFKRVWGDATGFLNGRRFGWPDLLAIAGIAGLLFGLLNVAGQWSAPHRAAVEINLSPWALTEYSLYSLCRGLLAYVFSLGFTLVYGYWAAKDPTAERVLVPLLDVLQSIPVLGFMPGLVLALAAIFPSTNVGLELAAVFMIFTGQVWNMTFSFYQSLKSVPPELREVAAVYRFGWWRELRQVELPFATIGLVWNSMMSMAGGWFFLMVSEAFVLGGKDYRLPGIGSYMSVAVERGDGLAMSFAVLAMVAMIVALDQFLWRPVVVWAQKFRLEEGGTQESTSSWALDMFRRSRFFLWLGQKVRGLLGSKSSRGVPENGRSFPSGNRVKLASPVLFAGLLMAMGFGGVKLFQLLRSVTIGQWLGILGSAVWTLGRVLLATAAGTLWAVPVGLAIGLRPRVSRFLQPLVQVAASFPAPMVFPVLVVGLKALGIPLGWGSVFLMMLGTQWYILFNVVAGAMAVPADLREAARSYRFNLGQRFRQVYLPAVFPYLVTGWVTAAGGAWNASIVSEYVLFRGEVLAAGGLGARISHAAASANFPVLAASVTVMSASVVLFNRTVWRSLYNLAESKFSIGK